MKNHDNEKETITVKFIDENKEMFLENYSYIKFPDNTTEKHFTINTSENNTVTNHAKKSNHHPSSDLYMSEDFQGQSTEPTDFSRNIARKAWSTEKTWHLEPNPDLVEEFARIIEIYIEALMWCSGSSDFAPGGQAYKGWNIIVKPLISK